MYAGYIMQVKCKAIHCLHKTLRQVITWKCVVSEISRWICCRHAMTVLHTRFW